MGETPPADGTSQREGGARTFIVAGIVVDLVLAVVILLAGVLAEAMMSRTPSYPIEALLPVAICLAIPAAGHWLFKNTQVSTGVIGLLVWSPLLLTLVWIMAVNQYG